MKRFFTSDLHLGHQNIIKFCDRPYSGPIEMNEDLVRRWNEVVGADDEVVIVGDLAMGKLNESLYYVKEMNGHKSLVPGNHDRMFDCSGEKYKMWVDRYGIAGIEEVLEPELEIKINGTTVLINHFPYRGESVEGREDRYEESRPADHGQSLVHGHTHGVWRKSGTMIDVGVDAWGGYPVEFETVADLFANGPEHLAPVPW